VTAAGPIPCEPADDDIAAGTLVEVGVRPENLSFVDGPGGKDGVRLRGTLRSRTFVGDAILSTIEIAGATVVVKSHPAAGAPSAPGPVELVAAAEHCIAFPASVAEAPTDEEER
jgi:hypothetical protein